MINSLHVVQRDEHPTKVHTASFFLTNLKQILIWKVLFKFE